MADRLSPVSTSGPPKGRVVTRTSLSRRERRRPCVPSPPAMAAREPSDKVARNYLPESRPIIDWAGVTPAVVAVHDSPPRMPTTGPRATPYDAAGFHEPTSHFQGQRIRFITPAI